MFKLFALVFAAILAVVACKPALVAPGVGTYEYTGYPYGYSPYSYSGGYIAPYSAGYVAPNVYSAGYASPYGYSADNGYYGYKYANPYQY